MSKTLVLMKRLWLVETLNLSEKMNPYWAKLQKTLLMKKKSYMLFLTFVTDIAVHLVESVSACREGDLGWLAVYGVPCVLVLVVLYLLTWETLIVPFMNSVIDQISHPFGTIAGADRLPMFTIQVPSCTMWPWLLRGCVKVGLVLPVVSCCAYLCAREESQTTSIFCICITTLEGRHCIVGVKWMRHPWLLWAHNATRSYRQDQEVYSRSCITMMCLMLCSSNLFTWDFGGLWFTYSWCQMMCSRQESRASYWL